MDRTDADLLRLTRIITDVPKKPERDDSLYAQLSDLYLIADRMGMSKAADFLNRCDWEQLEPRNRP